MASFPLLTLSFLAIEEVLKNLNPLELFILSQCSKRASGFVPLAGVKLLDVRIGDDPMDMRFVVNSDDAEWWFELEPTSRSEGFQEFSIKEIESDLLLIAYFVEDEDIDDLWSDKLSAIRRFVSYVLNTFKWKVNRIDVTYSEPDDIDLQDTIKSWLTRQNGRLAVLGVYADTTDEVKKWMLENITVTQKIIFMSEVEEGFQVNFETTCKHLEINYAQWITPRQLVSFESCKTIILSNGHFNQEYVDIVMKELQNGKLPNLQYLKLSNVDVRTVLGYSWRQLTEKKNSIREMRYNNHYIHSKFGVDFNNNNGVECSLQINPSTNKACLEFFLWRK